MFSNASCDVLICFKNLNISYLLCCFYRQKYLRLEKLNVNMSKSFMILLIIYCM